LFGCEKLRYQFAKPVRRHRHDAVFLDGFSRQTGFLSKLWTSEVTSKRVKVVELADERWLPGLRMSFYDSNSWR
jgi:hypothetical protein